MARIYTDLYNYLQGFGLIGIQEKPLPNLIPVIICDNLRHPVSERQSAGDPDARFQRGKHGRPSE